MHRPYLLDADCHRGERPTGGCGSCLGLSTTTTSLLRGSGRPDRACPPPLEHEDAAPLTLACAERDGCSTSCGVLLADTHAGVLLERGAGRGPPPSAGVPTDEQRPRRLLPRWLLLHELGQGHGLRPLLLAQRLAGRSAAVVVPEPCGPGDMGVVPERLLPLLIRLVALTCWPPPAATGREEGAGWCRCWVGGGWKGPLLAVAAWAVGPWLLLAPLLKLLVCMSLRATWSAAVLPLPDESTESRQAGQGGRGTGEIGEGGMRGGWKHSIDGRVALWQLGNRGRRHEGIDGGASMQDNANSSKFPCKNQCICLA